MAPGENDASESAVPEAGASPASYAAPAEGTLARRVAELIDAGETAAVQDIVDALHAADVADLIEQLPSEYRIGVLEVLEEADDAETLAEALVSLDETVRDEVMQELAPETIADALNQLDSDDALYLIEDMEEEDKQKVLRAIPPDERAVLETALSYPEDSAGRIMQREIVSVPAYWTVGQVIDFLRTEENLPDNFYEIFVVDPMHRPIGTMPLSTVLRSARKAVVSETMQTGQRLIRVDQDQEEVAYQFTKYHLISAAVVDGEGRLAGMITADDIADVIEEEAEDDILKLSGVTEGDINRPITDESRSRLVWLMFNMLSAFVTSNIINFFSGSIQKLVALAMLMPIVASMGGNAATQTLAVTVRAIATRNLTASNTFRIIGKEVAIGLLNGAALGAIVGIVASAWFRSAGLGLVMGSAVVINFLVAAMVGILVPLTLHKRGIDPAVGSTVFVTMCTDAAGFFTFLGLATLFLL